MNESSCASSVAISSGESSLLRKPSIAIHDEPDVPRNTPRFQEFDKLPLEACVLENIFWNCQNPIKYFKYHCIGARGFKGVKGSRDEKKLGANGREIRSRLGCKSDAAGAEIKNAYPLVLCTIACSANSRNGQSVFFTVYVDISENRTERMRKPAP